MYGKKKDINTEKNKVISERHRLFDITCENDYKNIVLITKALSSEERLHILKLLGIQSMSIVEIATKLNIPVSTTAFHIKVLEEANIVVTYVKPGVRGSMRVCSANLEMVQVIFEPLMRAEENVISIDMPVGNFYDSSVIPTCGLAGESGIIGSFDNPRAFYNSLKINAELLWFHEGYVEYRFPNNEIQDIDIKTISFSLELCSEAPGYREDWPSDISIILNSKEIAIYHSAGDYGKRRGLITPKTWGHGSTQYGVLKNFSVKESGSYIDENLYDQKINIDSLNLKTSPYISFVVAVKNTAKYVGGVNIFGEKFGDYPQGIVMRVFY